MAPNDVRPTEFETLIEEARAGSEEAAQRLFDRYGKHVVRVVRRLMPRGHLLRRWWDSIDFRQTVLAEAISAIKKGETFNDPSALVAFLCTLTENHYGMVVRQAHAQKRSLHLQQPLDALGDVASAKPGPADMAEFHEDWQRLLAGVPPAYRAVLQRRRAGWTAPEIAENLNLSLRTVDRILKKHWERWKQIRGGGERRTLNTVQGATAGPLDRVQLRAEFASLPNLPLWNNPRSASCFDVATAPTSAAGGTRFA